MKIFIKIAKVLAIIIAALIGFAVLLYLTIIPRLISNNNFINQVEKLLNKELNIDLRIESPRLDTDFSPIIKFSVKDVTIAKDNVQILAVNNFNINLSWAEILNKKIILNKATVKYIYADASKLSDLVPKEEKPKKKEKNPWTVDIFNSDFFIKEMFITYKYNDNVFVKLYGDNIEITDSNNPKFIKFNFLANLFSNKREFVFKINDNDKVYIKDNTVFVDNCDFHINNFKILVNLNAKDANNYNVKLSSKNMDIGDIAELVKSNIFIPNGKELLGIVDKINGKLDFNIAMSNDDLNGNVNVKSLKFIVPMFQNIPVTINSTNVKMDSKNIAVTNIKGFYGKNTQNTIDFNGKILDYMKSVNVDFTGFVSGTKELTKDYVTPMVGYPLELIGKTLAKVDFKMLNDKMDVTVIFRLRKGCDILVDGTSMTPVNYERAFKADMELVKNIFKLKNLNYYIANEFKAGVKATPLVQVYGNFDITNMGIKNVGFNVTKPLPSEFLNLFLGGRVFRKGTIDGDLEYIATGKVPYIKGNIKFDEVLVPSQRLSIKKGRLIADNNGIGLDIGGRFRRTDYSVNGNILNEIKFPITVKKLDLKIVDLNIENILESIARQQERERELATEQIKKADITQALASSASDANETTDEATPENSLSLSFLKGLLVIENCVLKIQKGEYKQIDFGNVNATMTFDKNGIFKVHSNRFDIAKGISSAHILCDLNNSTYNIKLGVREVDADIMSTSLLNLPREITGLASGLIDLETDNSLKMNGSMKFEIKNGTIAKIGLIEYALNFVALFRNPLTMISPLTIMDLVNVPEGNFDRIYGTLTLKDNSISKMMIKSEASQLSSYIIGGYNLEKADATLRIYTKFSNKRRGMAGVLRNISLNALATRVSLKSRNEVNYYQNEINQLPPIKAEDKDCQIFLTRIDGDVEKNNFLSSLKRIK